MESVLFLNSITFIYFLLNILRVFSYVPQIITLSQEISEAKAMSLTTWSFWSAANFFTGVYALFVLKDTLLILMSFSNTLGCGIVVGLLIYKRKKYAPVNVYQDCEVIIEYISTEEMKEMIRS